MSFYTAPKCTCTRAYLPFSSTLQKPFARLLFVCATAVPFSTTFGHAATPEEQAVLAPVQDFLDGASQHNQNLMREQLLPGGMATIIRNGQPIQLPYEALVERVSGIASAATRIEELLHDPVVHIDDDIAVIWAPYTVTVDSKIDHCGTNIFSLIRRNGRWLISNIADNSRKSCAAK